MKCCEFLYFYLLPENATELPDMAGATVPAAEASTIKHNRSESRIGADDISRPGSPDLGLPFVPQTPRKPTKPSLGFATPSANRTGTARKVSPTPSLGSVNEDAQLVSDSDMRRRDSNVFDVGRRNSSRARDDRRDSVVYMGESRSSSGSSSGSSITVVPGRRTAQRSSTDLPTLAEDGERRPTHQRAQSAAAIPSTPRVRSKGFPAEITRGRPTSAATPSSSSATPSPALSRPSSVIDLTRDVSRLSLDQSRHSVDLSRQSVDLSRASATPVSRPTSAAPSPAPTPVRPALGNARRVPSQKRVQRSVEEKKELLGQWLGNVDQLVQGVEKVGMWRGHGGRERGERA